MHTLWTTVSLDAAIQKVQKDLPPRVQARSSGAAEGLVASGHHYLQLGKEAMDRANHAAKSARGDVSLLMQTMSRAAPGMHAVFSHAVAEEDGFLGQVEHECSLAVAAMEQQLARLREALAFNQEQVRSAAKGAHVRLQERVKKLRAASEKSEAHLRAATLRVVAEWSAMSTAYKMVQSETLAAVQAMKDAMAPGSDERAACDAALATLRALQDLMLTAEEDMVRVNASVEPGAGKDSDAITDLSLVYHTIRRTRDQVVEVVKKSLDVGGSEALDKYQTPETVEARLRGAKAAQSTAEKRQAKAREALEVLAKNPEVQGGITSAIAARHEKQIADADVTAATDHVKVLVEELSKVRVQQVFRRLSEASSAQSAWMDTARRLKHAAKTLMASTASKKEKQRVCEETTKWAAEKTVQEARALADRALATTTSRVQEVMVQILRTVADRIGQHLQSEASTRPRKLSLQELGSAMEGTPQAATLALQYYKSLEHLCGTYVAAATANLDLVFAWTLQKVDEF
jgi:hypothetical protein